MFRTTVMSGAHQSIFSQIPRNQRTQVQLSLMTSLSAPDSHSSLRGKDPGGFLAPTPSCNSPSSHRLFWGL